MKKILLFLLVVSFLSIPKVFAYAKGSHPSWDTSTYGHDANGHLTRNDNMGRDSDGDGVSNYYDHNDRNSSVW